MIEDIGGVHAEDQFMALLYFGRLSHREIRIENPWSGELAPLQRPEIARRWEEEDLPIKRRAAVGGHRAPVLPDNRSRHEVRTCRSHPNLEEVVQLRRGEV